MERELEIEKLMWENETLKLFTARELQRLLTHDELRFFCNKHAIYQLPTVELIAYLKNLLSPYDPSDVIEIGAGAGHIGRLLGIRMTDLKAQDDPTVQAYYSVFQQPIIHYGADVEQLDANAAVEKYKPRVVLGCWVTERPKLLFGVDEPKMLSMIEKYIFVGNRIIHDKPILLRNGGKGFDWLMSRASYPKENRIWIIQGSL